MPTPRDRSNHTDAYIAEAPDEVQDKLRQLRAAIREVAPDATERTDYFDWPGYSYDGYDYNGMFAWFSYKHEVVRLHVRPPVIENHASELKNYKTTKAVVSLPVADPLPLPLVKQLVQASLDAMRASGRG